MARLSYTLERIIVPGARARTAYDVHQLLWRAFPGLEAGTAQPFLYRADRLRDGPTERVVVLVQPERDADWSMLGPDADHVRVERAVELEAGAQLRFFLRANPTVARKGRTEPATKELEGAAFRAARGRRVALVREEDRVAWLERQGERHGFRILHRPVRAGGEVHQLPELRTSNAHTTWWSRAGERRVRHDGVDFEGVLEVVDADALARAVRAGIGPAKALGYGLLSLRPAP